MAWTEGERVGGYILGRQLGQGGMATVYLAHHPQLDRHVAIKVMHQNFLDDEGFVARFKREAQIVAKLSHPHIIPVYDFDEYEGQPYLVLKYVPGFTLKKQVIKDPPDLNGVLDVITSVGDALNYAHEQGVLHRDIKPSNIVIDSQKVPYLTDFGLARLASSGESTISADMLLGTPHYISPEQARGITNLDNRTDIYSLGVVLYELLVGRVPFTGDTAFSIIHDHIYTPLPPPSQVNPELPQAVEDVLFKALAKQPEDRYETANELVKDLRDAIQRGHLTELNPNRASVAEESLAKIREEYDNQPTVTPVAGVSSPFPTDASVRQATMFPKKKAFYEQERFWLISGCASLLVIVFASFAVLLSMAGNFQELASLDLDADTPIEQEASLPFEPITDLSGEYTDLGIVLDSEGIVPIISIPYVASENIPDAVNDPIIALVRARSLYQEANVMEARAEIIQNIPNSDEDRVLYFVNAAQVAMTVEDRDATVIFSIVAAETSTENDALFDAVRPIVLENIYLNADDLAITNFGENLRTLIENDFIEESVLLEFVESPFTEFATARNLIANDNTRLAQAALLREPNPNPIAVEFQLLRAELQIQLGNVDNARRILEGILEDDAHDWIISRAEELLSELE